MEEVFRAPMCTMEPENRVKLEKALKAVSCYQNAMENEKLKYKLGFSTILDILNTEDRLMNGKLKENWARLNLMMAIINLRHQTGTIFKESR